MTIPSALIRKSGSKSIILQSEYNALVDLATASRFMSSGVADVMGGGGYDYGGTVPKHQVTVFSQIQIPMYSIFCIKPDPVAAYINPLMVEVEQANNNNQSMYLTNSESGGYGDYNGTHFCCQAEIIAGQKVYMFQLYTGSGKVKPRVGYPCGVKLNTFEIDGDEVGFICMALDEPNNIVYCTLTLAGLRWLVKPINLIAKNGVKGDVAVWSGTAGAEVAISPQLKYTNVCNRTGADIAATKFSEMVVIWGKKYIVPWECAAQ